MFYFDNSIKNLNDKIKKELENYSKYRSHREFFIHDRYLIQSIGFFNQTNFASYGENFKKNSKTPVFFVFNSEKASRYKNGIVEQYNFSDESNKEFVEPLSNQENLERISEMFMGILNQHRILDIKYRNVLRAYEEQEQKEIEWVI